MWGNLKLRNLTSGTQCRHQQMFSTHNCRCFHFLHSCYTFWLSRTIFTAAREIISKAVLAQSMLQWWDAELLRPAIDTEQYNTKIQAQSTGHTHTHWTWSLAIQSLQRFNSQASSYSLHFVFIHPVNCNFFLFTSSVKFLFILLFFNVLVCAWEMCKIR